MKKKVVILLALMVLVPLVVFSQSDVITIVYGDSYKPFAWGENGIAYGVQPDFVEEILVKRMGLKVKHEAYPWARGQKMVEEGSRDGFFTVPTPTRAAYTITSALPFYETHFVMHTSKNNPNFAALANVKSMNDLEKLTNVRHLYMLGSGWHENVLKNVAQKSSTPDATKIPQMIVLNRADVYIEQAEMFRFQAKSAGLLKDVHTFYQPSLGVYGWHIFFGNASKHKGLMVKIDETLKKLKASGELDKIKASLFAKHGIE